MDRELEPAVLRGGPLDGRQFVDMADEVRFNDGSEIHRYRFTGYEASGVDVTIFRIYRYVDSWQDVDRNASVT